MGRQTNNRFMFTERRIGKLPTPEKGFTPYYDEEVPKLTARAYASGSKVYYVGKRNKAGIVKPHRLGDSKEMTVEEARNAAIVAVALINKGVDPNDEKKKNEVRSQTLRQLLDSYIENHTLKPRTIKDYNDRIGLGFGDWLSKPASDITEKMILARHKRVTKRGKTSTNGIFRPLRAVLNYSHAIGAIDSNPVNILSAARLWHKDKRKTDKIAYKQLGEWLQAVEQLEPVMHRVAFKLMIYLGYRIGETYKIKWADVDLDEETIIQRDTKNGTNHQLPLPSLLVPMIAELKEEAGDTLYMFPAVSRDGYHGRPKRQLEALNELISFEFNPHMTRHTFVTIAEAVGISSTIIKRLTNHTMTNDVTDGYIHTEMETMRKAINEIAAYIQSRSAPAEQKVVQIYG
jgi:integrase